MDAVPSLHPTDQTLHAFGLGKLDDGSAEAVNTHLEQCPECQRRVAEVSADSFLDRVRDAQGSGSSATGPSHAGGSRSTPGDDAPAPPPADTLPPGLADHPDYQIKRELGRGGMGVVYLAYNSLMGRDEVLKVMGRQIMERPGVLDRFLREIRAVARLRHPNIVTAYSAVRLGESIVFAMEYVEGLDLSRLVKAKGSLPVGHACHFVHQAALGLQHAHEEGLVHRDIKPGNLMLARKGDRATVKVLDFGLARATREEAVDTRLTSEGQALGTPDYIAPEQILDAPSADVRADLYSLGGTLYYLLTGRPPFKAKSLYDIYQAHISRDADPLNLIRPEVPAELAALVAKMMAKDPARRFQTPREVAQALTPFFKKASVRPIADLSQAGPSVAGPTPAGSGLLPTPPATAAADQAAAPAPPSGPALEGSMWKSLIDLHEKERPAEASASLIPSTPPEAPGAAPEARRGRKWPAVAVGAALLVFVLAWAVATVRVKTRDGVLVLEGVPEQAEVLVDGAKVTARWPGGGGPLEVTVPAGRRGVQVKTDGFQTFGDEVSVATGERAAVRVRLVPLDATTATREEAHVVVKSSSPEAPVRIAEANPWPEALAVGGQKVAPNGQIVAMSHDGRLLAQRIPPMKLFRIIKSPGASSVETELFEGFLWSGAFSPDGKYLATCADDTGVRFWDTATGKLVRQGSYKGRVVRVAFSPNGTRLALVFHNGDMIQVFDATTGALQNRLIGHSDNPWCAAFSPDGTRLATGSGPWEDKQQSPGEVKVWDLQTGACTNLAGHAMRTSDVAFSPDGRYLVSTSFDKTAKVWDLKTLRCVTAFDRHQGYVIAARFSPDGRLVASIAREDAVRVWEAATGREIAVLSGFRARGPFLVQFSPEGRWIFAGAGHTLKAWEAPASPTDSPVEPRGVADRGAATDGPRSGSAPPSAQMPLGKPSVPNAEAPADSRRVWLAISGNRFERGQGKQWTEWAPKENHRFDWIEVRRDEEYVELFDGSRFGGGIARLFDDRVELKWSHQDTFHLLYPGRWDQPAPGAAVGGTGGLSTSDREGPSTTQLSKPPPPSSDGFVSLFNGKDLEGWTPKIKGEPPGVNYKDTFRVEDGVLKVSYDQYPRFDGRFGHLFSRKKYANYRLRIEYRFVGDQCPGGPAWALRNSGVMIHSQSPESMRKDQNFPACIEVHLLGGDGRNERPTANVCTPGTHIVMDGKLITKHYTESRSRTYHGDQWVTVEVEVHGNRTIKHLVDGATVLEYEGPQLDEKDPDARELIRGGDKRLREGYIALQAESHPIEFRKVEIKELDSPVPAGGTGGLPTTAIDSPAQALVDVPSAPPAAAGATASGTSRTPDARAEDHLEEVARLPFSVGGLAFAPDSKRFAYYMSGRPGLKFGSVELEGGRRVFAGIVPKWSLAVGESGSGRSVVVAADGNLVTSHHDQTVRVWQQADGKRVREFEPKPLGEVFRNLRSSAEAGWIVGVGQTQVRLWDYKTGKEFRRYTPASPVKSLDMHPNGRELVTLHNNHIITVWDARSGRELVKFPDPTERVVRVSFSSDGRHLLCLPHGIPEFFLVDASNGATTRMIQGPGTNLVDAALFPNGRWAVSLHSDNALRVWDIATGRLLYAKPFDTEATQIDVAPDGRYIVVVLKGKATVVYHVHS